MITALFGVAITAVILLGLASLVLGIGDLWGSPPPPEDESAE